LTSFAVIKPVPLFQPLILQPQHQHLGSEINIKENYLILYPKQTKLPMRTFTEPKYWKYLCLLTSPTRYRSNFTADLGSKTPPAVFYTTKTYSEISYTSWKNYHV